MPKIRHENSIWFQDAFMIHSKLLYKCTVKLRAKSEEVKSFLFTIRLYIWVFKHLGVKINGEIYQNNLYNKNKIKIRDRSGCERS